MNKIIRLVIADDHALLRGGLKMLLDAEEDMQVVGEAADGVEAVQVAEALRPDLILLDITMPVVNGISAIHEIKEKSPSTAVLMMTMHDDEGYLREALSAGAAGYVLKQAADQELLSAIRAVYQGGTYLHRNHAHLLLEKKTKEPMPCDELSFDSLSMREQEVFKLLAIGYTNKQCADQMYLSVKTIETYKARLMTKLNLHNRAELVRFAIRNDIRVDMDEM